MEPAESQDLPRRGTPRRSVGRSQVRSALLQLILAANPCNPESKLLQHFIFMQFQVTWPEPGADKLLH